MKKDLKTKALFLSLISASIFGAEDLDRDLRLAISSANVHEVRPLIEKGANVNARFKKNQETPLIFTARLDKLYDQGLAKITSELLSKEADSVAQDRWGMTALMWAARNDLTGVLRTLLKNRQVKKTIDMQDEAGNTALIHAVRDSGDVAPYDFVEIVKTLLLNGANPNIENKLKKTALVYATYNNQLFIIGLLLAFDAEEKRIPYLKSMKEAAKKMIRGKFRRDGGPSKRHPYHPASRQNY